MRPSTRLLALSTTVIAVLAVVSISQAANGATSATGAAHRSVRVCAAARAGEASCNALVRTDVAPAATPSGYGPADLRSAYALTASGSSAQTIGIVDAYDAPTAEADLAAYRTQFGLPACTTANGCFRKVDQNGGTNYPHRNTGWAQEISLDLDMASAICPNCHILLVEAKTNSFANLGAAENRAVTMAANVVSNSWGGSDASDASFGSFFNHPGVAITASSGDAGYGVEYPASSHFVTAVGGTHLVAGGGTRGWTETAWSGAGSGCSTFNTALSGAATADTGCTLRAEADVSAVADPNTGVAVRYNGSWLVFGGTSVASPIIAGVYALAGNEASIDNNYPYTHKSSLFDITSGSNGTCPTSQWCHARVGWDGPTGLGTPNGTGAF
jgi:subtilase family serine protease